MATINIQCGGHNLPAHLGKDNTGRHFFRCPKDYSSRCSFWSYADDLLLKRLNPSTAIHTSSHPNSQSSPSGQSQEFPGTPTKRGSQSSQGSPGQTGSEKRLRLAEHTLHDNDDLLQSPFQGTPTTSSKSTSTPTRGSQRRLDLIKEALSPGKPNLDDSPRPSAASSSASQTAGQAASAESIPPAATRQHLDKSNTCEQKESAITPSGFQTRNDQNSGHPLEEHILKDSTFKGKDPIRKAENTPLNWRSYDPDNPFGSLSGTQPNIQRTSYSSSTGLSADMIQALLSNLGDVPEYVRKLERRLIAADEGNAVKERRIYELEQTLERLRQDANQMIE